MGDTGEKIFGIVGAIIGLAVLAIIISAKANTASVLGAFFGGLSNLVGVAISPITGQSVSGLSAGLAGGAWSTGTSGFALNGGSYGVNQGGIGQITNMTGGGFLGGGGGGMGGLGGLLGGGGGGGMGGIGGLLGGGGGGGAGGFGSLLGGGGGAGAGAAQDFIDVGAFA